MINPFSKLYWAVTNPTEFLRDTIFQTVKGFLINSLWNYAINHLWQMAIIFFFKLVVWKCYNTYKDRRNAKKIFYDIKNRLRIIHQNSPNYETGLSEEEIIHDYSNSYKYKESDFRNNIFPLLKKYRKEDLHVKEFETYINGRNKTAWQWGGL